jgi:glucan endo-1,3-alpha-glucosidase
LNNIEGFFSWDMWLEGATNMADSSDLGWESATPGKIYVVGISPCFFFAVGVGWESRFGVERRGDDLWWIDSLRL